MSILFIDIETIPSENGSVRDRIAREISPPSNYSKPETIDKWWQEQGRDAIEKKIRSTALDGLYGQIVSVAWAFNDDGVESVQSRNEKVVLNELMCTLRDEAIDNEPIHLWVGHHVGFDLLYLWQRCVIHGIKPPVHIPAQKSTWSPTVFDTCAEWAGHDRAYQGAKGLQELSRVILGDDEDDISGGEVYDRILAHDWVAVRRHNELDVERVRNLYRRMTFTVENF